ncbi:MAG: peptidylprolyl isomerase [Acidobacteriia bacterium]|nr:peptidylprolyl isomerase [Terriglobia bacterium]
MLVLGSFALSAQTATEKLPAKSTSSAKTKKPVPAANPVAILHTTAGDLKCELFPTQAPKAVANFIGLAKGTKDWKEPLTGKIVHGKPLYDGVIFHRTIPEFMIQGGDPSGTGSGDVGFTFQDELHADLLFDKPGRLAMANRGPNTNSSQFFITEKEVPFLNPCLDPNGCMGGRRPPNSGYTLFGQCDDASVDLVKRIARMPCSGGVTCSNNNSRPLEPVKIKHVEIAGHGPAAPSPAKKKSTTPKPAPSPKP